MSDFNKLFPRSDRRLERRVNYEFSEADSFWLDRRNGRSRLCASNDVMNAIANRRLDILFSWCLPSGPLPSKIIDAALGYVEWEETLQEDDLEPGVDCAPWELEDDSPSDPDFGEFVDKKNSPEKVSGVLNSINKRRGRDFHLKARINAKRLKKIASAIGCALPSKIERKRDLDAESAEVVSFVETYLADSGSRSMYDCFDTNRPSKEKSREEALKKVASFLGFSVVDRDMLEKLEVECRGKALSAISERDFEKLVELEEAYEELLFEGMLKKNSYIQEYDEDMISTMLETICDCLKGTFDTRTLWFEIVRCIASYHAWKTPLEERDKPDGCDGRASSLLVKWGARTLERIRAEKSVLRQEFSPS